MQHFHCAYHSQSSGEVEIANGTIKIQLAKFTETFNLPWPKPLLLLLLNLRSTPFGKHQLSLFKTKTEQPMRLNKGLYEPTALKWDILSYF